MSVQTATRAADPLRAIAPFEHDGLRFSLVSGLRTVPGEVPGYLFEVRNADGAILGTVSGLVAPDVNGEAGQIGVEVEPMWRGQGLPGRFARGLIPLLRQDGAEEILLTCDAQNDAMKATIESLGAQYLDEWPGADHGAAKRRYVLRGPLAPAV